MNDNILCRALVTGEKGFMKRERNHTDSHFASIRCEPSVEDSGER